MRKCCLCIDFFAKDDGQEGQEGHVVCWECVLKLTEQALGEDRVGMFNDEDGNLKCSSDGPHIFDIRDAAKSNQDVFNALEKIRIVRQTERILQDAIEKEGIRLNAEMDRILAITNA